MNTLNRLILNSEFWILDFVYNLKSAKGFKNSTFAQNF